MEEVYRHITNVLFQNIANSFNASGDPTIEASRKIIDILISHIFTSNKDFKDFLEMQKWDQYQFSNKKITDNIIEELVADWSCFQNKLEHKNFLLGCVEVRRIVDIHTGLFNDSSMKLGLIENYPEVMNMAL